jgi:hypothetical protein
MAVWLGQGVYIRMCPSYDWWVYDYWHPNLSRDSNGADVMDGFSSIDENLD